MGRGVLRAKWYRVGLSKEAGADETPPPQSRRTWVGGGAVTMTAREYGRGLGEMRRMPRPWRGSDAGKGLNVRRAGSSPGQKAERVRRTEAPVVYV